MELLANTHIDFMKYRKVFVSLSIVVSIFCLVLLFTGSINLGIDFAGGTQLIVRFQEPHEIDELRDLLDGIFEEAPMIQRFGDTEDNEVIIKTRLIEGEEEGSRRLVVEALQRRYDSAAGVVDLNEQGRAATAGFLLSRDPDGVGADGQVDAADYYNEVADAIFLVRRDLGIFSSWDELRGVDGVSPEVLAALEAEASLGAFAVLSAENVGPQIGSELRQKGTWAVILSLAGMLFYIWWRFEFRFGVGALVALMHDVVIALGLFTFFGYEFNLTTIAAFLTVVGYSVNDSVVIFDRVRENLRRSRRQPLVDVLNESLNQTLSRTVLTSGTTILVIGTLFLFGGDVIRGFSFVLLIGIVVGTYSSVFIASPVMLAWEKFTHRNG